MLVPICVHFICIILPLQHKYSASLQHRRNWCQTSLPIARRLSRANGGAPVPAPMVALRFRRVLTSVRPTPIPPTPHPVHPSHPASNQLAHKSQCFLIQPIRYGPIQPILYDSADNTIRSSRQYDTIQLMILYDTVSPLTIKTHSRPIISCLTVSASRFDTTFPTDAPLYTFSPSPATSAARHLLSSSDAASCTAYFSSG